MSIQICKACAAENCFRTFQAKEMMLGLGHVFDYGECQVCGSIQIMSVPENLSKYYPDGYYSCKPPSSARKTLRQWLAQQRQEHATGRVNHIGWFLTVLCGTPSYVELDWVRLAGVSPEHKVLDMGCGHGAMLVRMREEGFKNLTGVDPYMRTEIKTDGFMLFRKEIRDLDGPFDVIMLHHSFEHMAYPLETLKEIHRLLVPTGVVIIRTPIAGSYVWRTYGAHWFQLDAPRHLFIPSDKGFQILAKRTGFGIFRTVYDSTYIQFVGSEQYARDIPISRPDDKRYTKRELQFFTGKAKRLNETRDGDQAGFFLRKATQT